MGTILVLTHRRDDTASMVLSHLQALGADCVRFNTDDFQAKIKCTLDLSPNGKFSGRYVFPDRVLPFDEIAVVWNRRTHQPTITEPSSDPEILTWMKEETMWGLSNSITLIDAPCVNPWEVNERLKYNKWIQMRRAAELGLEIPLSRMTNEASAMREFWEHCQHDMIFKKIRKGLFRYQDRPSVLVHTSRIPEDRMTDDDIRRMRFTPMFFQSHVHKKYDVRAVVIGDRVFSVAIHSQDVEDGVVDFRTAAVKGRLKQMKHEIIDLGDQLNRQLISFSRSFGLAFGAIDLIVTTDDRIVFLEDNPNGQWSWLEHMTGVPLARAYADYLLELGAHHEATKRR